MFILSDYPNPPILSAQLVGTLSPEEWQTLQLDLDRRIFDPRRAPRALMLDVSRLDSRDPVSRILLQGLEDHTINEGLSLAKQVDSEVVAHQLDRVARAAGALDRLRHFWSRSDALAWLRSAVA